MEAESSILYSNILSEIFNEGQVIAVYQILEGRLRERISYCIVSLYRFRLIIGQCPASCILCIGICSHIKIAQNFVTACSWEYLKVFFLFSN